MRSRWANSACSAGVCALIPRPRRPARRTRRGCRGRRSSAACSRAPPGCRPSRRAGLARHAGPRVDVDDEALGRGGAGEVDVASPGSRAGESRRAHPAGRGGRRRRRPRARAGRGGKLGSRSVATVASSQEPSARPYLSACPAVLPSCVGWYLGGTLGLDLERRPAGGVRGSRADRRRHLPRQRQRRLRWPRRPRRRRRGGARPQSRPGLADALGYEVPVFLRSSAQVVEIAEQRRTEPKAPT